MSVSALLLLATAVSASAPGGVPGPASGRSQLRYTVVTAELSPPEIAPGQVAELTVVLSPRDGYAWRDARLVPPAIEVRAPVGWRAEPTQPALSAIRSPKGRRAFRVNVLRGDEGSEIKLSLRYACVRLLSAGLGKLLIEEAEVVLSMPSGHTAPEAVALVAPDAGGSNGTDGDGTSTAQDESGDSASPLLPALFFAGATLLVLAGIAVYLRQSKKPDASGGN